jgi:hypothetical protein
MNAVSEQPINIPPLMWECKQCHHLISDAQTVAYHLVDRVLYGWCEPCFAQQTRKTKMQAKLEAPNA